MRKVFTFFIAVFLLQLQQKLYAQERIVSGTVHSADNTPVSGASVVIKGTGTGTQTDASGKFSIKAATGQVLEISFIGFDQKQVKVGESSNIEIILSPKDKSMEDIVVVGYGTQKRGDVTGSISTINVKQTLTARPIADVGRGLQGQYQG